SAHALSLHAQASSLSLTMLSTLPPLLQATVVRANERASAVVRCFMGSPLVQRDGHRRAIDNTATSAFCRRRTRVRADPLGQRIGSAPTQRSSRTFGGRATNSVTRA